MKYTIATRLAGCELPVAEVPDQTADGHSIAEQITRGLSLADGGHYWATDDTGRRTASFTAGLRDPALYTTEEIRQFRADCQQVRNFPLALLCSDALAGKEDAISRVTRIMNGEGDTP